MANFRPIEFIKTAGLLGGGSVMLATVPMGITGGTGATYAAIGLQAAWS
jgi:hypothetical protein